MGAPRSFALALNNRNGYNCGQVIAESGDMPVLLLLHPSAQASFDEEIQELFPSASVIRWGEKTPSQIAGLFVERKIDLLLSVNFGYLFPRNLLKVIPDALNLHMGLLPWGRGSNPNVWSLVDRSPAGVSLHRMTERVDHGEVLAAVEVGVLPEDTGLTLYRRLEKASVSLIRDAWPVLRERSMEGKPMESGGTEHRVSEMKELCRLDLDEVNSLGRFIDRLRALSFPPYRNAYFVHDGRRFYVEIKITPGEEE